MVADAELSREEAGPAGARRRKPVDDGRSDQYSLARVGGPRVEVVGEPLPL